MGLYIRIVEVKVVTSIIEFHISLINKPGYEISNQLLIAILKETNNTTIDARGLPINELTKKFNRMEDKVFFDLLSKSSYVMTLHFKANFWMATLHGGIINGREAMIPYKLLDEIVKRFLGRRKIDVEDLKLSELPKMPSIDAKFLNALEEKLAKK